MSPLCALRKLVKAIEEDTGHGDVLWGKEFKQAKHVLATTCWTCGNDKGRERIDNGLGCGVHCDPCFDKMIRECRSRSW